MAAIQKINKGWIFLVSTLAITWIFMWGPLVISGTPGASFSGPPGPIWAVALFILGGFVPSVLAILLTWKEKNLASLRKQLKPRLLCLKGWGTILLVFLLGTAGQLLILNLHDCPIDLREFLRRLPLLFPLLILGPLSEELGWRGYALPHLQDSYNGLTASLIVGLAWSLWHLPLFFIPGTFHSIYGISFAAFTLGTTATSILYTWIFNSTGGSLWSAVVIHWFYTFIMDTLGGAIVPPPVAWQWQQHIPYLAMAIIVVIIFGPELNVQNSKKKDKHTRN